MVISSELPEIIGTCDRVLIMREGELVAEVGGASGQAISQERIIDLATGSENVAATAAHGAPDHFNNNKKETRP